MAVAGVNRPAQMLWPNPSPEGGGRVERSETGWGIARRLADGDAFAMTPHPAACGGHPPPSGLTLAQMLQCDSPMLQCDSLCSE
jgi:hypothetical protein